MSAKNLMIGSLTLLATGVVIGILIAPAKGSETDRNFTEPGFLGLKDRGRYS